MPNSNGFYKRNCDFLPFKIWVQFYVSIKEFIHNPNPGKVLSGYFRQTLKPHFSSSSFITINFHSHFPLFILSVCLGWPLLTNVRQKCGLLCFDRSPIINKLFTNCRQEAEDAGDVDWTLCGEMIHLKQRDLDTLSRRKVREERKAEKQKKGDKRHST